MEGVEIIDIKQNILDKWNEWLSKKYIEQPANETRDSLLSPLPAERQQAEIARLDADKRTPISS